MHSLTSLTPKNEFRSICTLQFWNEWRSCFDQIFGVHSWVALKRVALLNWLQKYRIRRFVVSVFMSWARCNTIIQNFSANFVIRNSNVEQTWDSFDTNDFKIAILIAIGGSFSSALRDERVNQTHPNFVQSWSKTHIWQHGFYWLGDLGS